MSAVLNSNMSSKAGAAVGSIKSEVRTPAAGVTAGAVSAAAIPQAPSVTAAPVISPAVRLAQRRALALRFIAPIAGFAMFVLLWQIIAQSGGQIPTPAKVWEAAIKIFSGPFYSKGPNDQGIGWNILASLQRVGIGFGFAALVGIPLGFMVGRFRFLDDMTSPIISLLRPVSPLAWLPIGLLVFKAANPAAIWTIFICSIWPMIINTAVGVRQIPQDYMNVARCSTCPSGRCLPRSCFRRSCHSCSPACVCRSVWPGW